jgi:hypothetical protein
MAAEQTQQIGLEGVFRGSLLLSYVFGRSIHLPFNAYDHGPKLRFTDIPGGTFNYDLGGVLERLNPKKTRADTTDVFVEVKQYKQGADLLAHYGEFLRHAVVMSLNDRYRDTWFVFLASVPFGSSKGIELCDGQYLADCKKNWPAQLKKAETSNLHNRISLLIFTASFERMLKTWSNNLGVV